MSQKLFLSCYTVTNLAGCKTRKWSCGWQRRDNSWKMPTACGVDERQDIAIKKYQQTHCVGTGCVLVVQAFVQLNPSYHSFQLFSMSRSRCLLHRPLVGALDTSSVWYQIKSKHGLSSDPQFASFVNFRGRKCFLLENCRKQCYQWMS